MSHALTRRALVAAVPAVTGLSVATLGATSALAHLSAFDPDAELLALGAELTTTLALNSELNEAVDTTYEGFNPPPIPEVLFWRPSHRPEVWRGEPGHSLDGIDGPNGEDRYTYARQDMPPELAQRLRASRALRAQYGTISQEPIDRLEEIVEALDIWVADEAKALAVCGFTAAQTASDRQHAILIDVLKQIGAIPARTAAGVCVKARAAFAASHKCIALVEAHGFAELSGKTELAVGELEELLTMSMMIDVHKLEAGAVGIERGVA